MRTKIAIFTLALITAFCISGRQGVNAAPSATTGIQGAVRFEGTVPKPKPISMAADPSCAKQHSAPVLAQDIVTDGKGGLEDVVVFVSEGLGDQKFDPPAQTVSFDQKGCMYSPHVLALQAGQPLEISNDDPTSHNIHPMPANNREWNRAELPGSKIEETFARQEIAIPVKCNVHPWMHGYVAVFKHPFFAVTGKNGSFEMKNLPPGTYTLQAWHEKLGTMSQKVTVAANQTQNIEFVFKGN
jgi:plastocyanin